MNASSFEFIDNRGKSIYTRKWEPKAVPVKGVVQIIHGISEHSARYELFAQYLCGSGYAVYAPDLPGHGRTAQNPDELGHVGVDGWNHMVQVVFELSQTIAKEHPGKPLFILGHSMGSFLLRQFMYQHRDFPGIAGYILSGTGSFSPLLLKFGRFLCRIAVRMYGSEERNKFIHGLTFINFNSRCDEKRTLFDWLSRANNEVDKYIADPLCGQICSAGFYLDFFRGIEKLQMKSNMKKIQKNIPVYFFSGEMDPVGRYGKKIRLLYQKYADLGIQDLSCRLYEGGRHEMLNEINRYEVMEDIVQWMNARNAIR